MCKEYDLLSDIKLIDYHVTGIYLLKIDKHLYIGSSVNIRHRLYCHKTELINKKHDNKFLQNCYNKYKNCRFLIIKTYNNKSNLFLRKKEKYYIKKYSADLNIDCPIKGIGGSTPKKVYQYDINGKYIKSFSSIKLAAKSIRGHAECISSCCRNYGNAKTYYNYIWSFKKYKKIIIKINTGSNLKHTKLVVKFLKTGKQKTFKSISSFAKYAKKDMDYKKDWKNLRTSFWYCIKHSGIYKNLYKIKPLE